MSFHIVDWCYSCRGLKVSPRDVNVKPFALFDPKTACCNSRRQPLGCSMRMVTGTTWPVLAWEAGRRKAACYPCYGGFGELWHLLVQVCVSWWQHSWKKLWFHMESYYRRIKWRLWGFFLGFPFPPFLKETAYLNGILIKVLFLFPEISHAITNQGHTFCLLTSLQKSISEVSYHSCRSLPAHVVASIQLCHLQPVSLTSTGNKLELPLFADYRELFNCCWTTLQQSGREYSIFSKAINKLITAQSNFYVYFNSYVKTQRRCFSEDRVYLNYYHRMWRGSRGRWQPFIG